MNEDIDLLQFDDEPPSENPVDQFLDGSVQSSTLYPITNIRFNGQEYLLFGQHDGKNGGSTTGTAEGFCNYEKPTAKLTEDGNVWSVEEEPSILGRVEDIEFLGEHKEPLKPTKLGVERLLGKLQLYQLIRMIQGNGGLV